MSGQRQEQSRSKLLIHHEHTERSDLKATIKRLTPRPATYAQALEAWEGGAMSLCADLLQASRAPNAIFLRSRCLWRLGRADEALAELLDLDLDELLPDHAAQLSVMRSTAFYVTRQRDAAIAQAQIAREYCRAIGNVAMEAELLNYKAIGLLLNGRATDVENVVTEIEAIAGEANSGYDSHSYPFSLGFWRSRVYEAASLAALICGEEQLRIMRGASALQQLELSGIRDDLVKICMLGNYADALRMAGLKEFARFSASTLEVFENNPDVAPALSAAYFNLAECASNEGEIQEALRLLRRATDLAPGGALQLRAIVARVDLLHESGETFGARDLLEQAIAFSQTIDWNSAPNFGRARQLIDLASRVAYFGPGHADRLLETYNSLDHHIDRVGGIYLDPGADAEEQVALAQIALSRHEQDRALQRFVLGLEMYRRLNYKSKIAAISFEIAKITHDHIALEPARNWANSHPQSLLARKIREFDDRALRR